MAWRRITHEIFRTDNIGWKIWRGVKVICGISLLDNFGYLGPHPVYLKDSIDVEYRNIKVNKNWIRTTVSYDVYEKYRGVYTLTKSVEECYNGHASVVHIKDGEILSNPQPFFKLTTTKTIPDSVHVLMQIIKEYNDMNNEETWTDNELQERCKVNSNFSMKFNLLPFIYE